MLLPSLPPTAALERLREPGASGWAEEPQFFSGVKTVLTRQQEMLGQERGWPFPIVLPVFPRGCDSRRQILGDLVSGEVETRTSLDNGCGCPFTTVLRLSLGGCQGLWGWFWDRPGH